MNETLQFFAKRYNLNLNQSVQPIEIPNTGRDTLAQLFAVLGFNVGAEVGVERGLYSEVLCKANPTLKLFAIDAWTAYGEYRDHVTQEKLDSIYDEAKKRLQPYHCRLVKGFSTNVVRDFSDNSLDFVYIDGNHEFKHVVEDIAVWSKKVRPGGIVAGHDYIKRKTTHKKQEYLMHVIPAVHGYIDAYQIKPLFVLGSKEKKEGQLRDSPRSWFFVKPEPRTVVPGYETTLDNK